LSSTLVVVIVIYIVTAVDVISIRGGGNGRHLQVTMVVVVVVSSTLMVKVVVVMRSLSPAMMQRYQGRSTVSGIGRNLPMKTATFLGTQKLYRKTMGMPKKLLPRVTDATTAFEGEYEFE